MTKQEIKDLVAAKIAGQGTQVDLGGALPEIINAIVDAIPSLEPKISLNVSEAFQDKSAEEAAETLGITVAELNEIPNQLIIKVNNRDLTRCSAFSSGQNWDVTFGKGDKTFDTQMLVSLTKDIDLYSLQFAEL